MTETRDASRRNFLKLAATAPAAAAVATVAGTDEAEAATGSETRLADTEQTRAYYDSARF
ncbi:twin-arginine translocation signal domain-containing protein [uncultured Jannaschia sp.]|uniref:twin-arginine translocation signal domain-containing protein n=1 Tax=uncultured Jannaschia sp. TaxID=293347 RepID=UPI0026115431|nr:twin-arginine translocation signal domain-containing protein [uncultured Jannaschia sp.]